jgi:hypothetical protein
VLFHRIYQGVFKDLLMVLLGVILDQLFQPH